MAVHQYSSNLFLIDLDQNLRGFRQFISCWLLIENGRVILVDPGPGSTIPVILQALRDMNIIKIDYILLTHIHIDHAGGTGLLIEKFPEVRLICHPKAIAHLVNPEQLWQGSLKVLGKVARAYGPVKPVPESSISFEESINLFGSTIDIIFTPGHAAHHICFSINDILFAGEVAGTNISLNNKNYIRIATPTVFIYEVFRESLLKVAALKAKRICFAHYGMRIDSDNVFNEALEQLDLWCEIIKKETARQNAVHDETLFNIILEKDTNLKSCYSALPADLRERETLFIKNSIGGIQTYYEKI